MTQVVIGELHDKRPGTTREKLDLLVAAVEGLRIDAQAEATARVLHRQLEAPRIALPVGRVR